MQQTAQRESVGAAQGHDYTNVVAYDEWMTCVSPCPHTREGREGLSCLRRPQAALSLRSSPQLSFYPIDQRCCCCAGSATIASPRSQLPGRRTDEMQRVHHHPSILKPPSPAAVGGQWRLLSAASRGANGSISAASRSSVCGQDSK